MSLPDEMSNASSKNPVVGEYDFVVDCCDNFATKLLINDVCVSMKKPYSVTGRTQRATAGIL